MIQRADMRLLEQSLTSREYKDIEICHSPETLLKL